MKQFISFVRKEFMHIFRDRRTMLILLVMPVVMIILFGFAITTEVKDTRVAILDYSKDEVTTQIPGHLKGSRYFTVVAELRDASDINGLFLRGEADMVMAFCDRFSERMTHPGGAEVQILTDGSEPNQASVRTGYAQQVLAEYAQEYAARHGVRPRMNIVPTVKMLYNPQSKSEYNFVPGVIGLILLLICAMMTSISIVKEKETGTMEVLLASPLPPIVIVLAKLVPYFVISCANLATILLLSVFLLHIPIAGSLAGFIAVTLLYILVALLLGLFISTVADSQLAAMLLSLLLIVPAVYLSGLAFPTESMPEVLRAISCVVPTTWYIEAARKLLIQGSPMDCVMRETTVLAVMATVLLAVSWRMFKVRLSEKTASPTPSPPRGRAAATGKRSFFTFGTPPWGRWRGAFLIEKEFKQMMRNIILPKVFVMLPLALVTIMPFAATQEVKNLTVTVVDNDHSQWSERLVHKMAASRYFTLNATAPSYGKALRNVEAGRSDFIVEIEPGFERNLIRDGMSHVLVSANAVNGVKAGLGSSYLAQIIASYSAELREEHGLSAGDVTMAQGFDIVPRYLFNGTLDYKRFMIPALMAMLLILTVGFLPALNIVGEKERGTIEQMNVTPVGRFEFILSKLIPYWCVGLVMLAYAMSLAYVIHGHVPAGSIGVIFLFATVFILVVSSLGLIVSNYSDTTRQAALTIFFFLVIFILMSGLLTPVAGMPSWAKAITTLNPLRYFIEAIRALYLKGSTLHDLMPHFLKLTAFAVATWGWAIYSYRKNS